MRARPDRPGTHYVYIAYNARRDVLYVGYTHQPRRRLWEHAYRSAWWQEKADVAIEGPMLRRAALDREQALIWTLGPVYNTPHPRDFRFFGLAEDGSTALTGAAA